MNPYSAVIAASIRGVFVESCREHFDFSDDFNRIHVNAPQTVIAKKAHLIELSMASRLEISPEAVTVYKSPFGCLSFRIDNDERKRMEREWIEADLDLVRELKHQWSKR